MEKRNLRASLASGPRRISGHTIKDESYRNGRPGARLGLSVGSTERRGRQQKDRGDD
jgi:hypothetical protein